MPGNFVSDLIKTAVLDLVFKRPVQLRITRDEHGRMDMQLSLSPSGERGQPNPWPNYMPMYSPQLMQPGYMVPGMMQPWAPPAIPPSPQQLQQPTDPAAAAMQAQAQNMVASLPKNWRS